MKIRDPFAVLEVHVLAADAEHLREPALLVVLVGDTRQRADRVESTVYVQPEVVYTWTLHVSIAGSSCCPR